MIRDAGYDQSLFLSRPLVSRSLTDLVHRLACNGDVVRQTPDQLTVFQGGPRRIGNAMRMPGCLIGERHQTGKDRAGQTRAADTVLIIVSAVRESLCLTYEQAGLRVG